MSPEHASVVNMDMAVDYLMLGVASSSFFGVGTLGSVGAVFMNLTKESDSCAIDSLMYIGSNKCCQVIY